MTARVRIAPPTAADEADFIGAMRASRRLHPRRAFFLARRIWDGAIVGFCNLSEIIRGKLQQAFMGYGGVAGFDGPGYVSETIRPVGVGFGAAGMSSRLSTPLRRHELSAGGGRKRNHPRAAPFLATTW
jgi:hypothetical protein